ncbi:MAG: hypothetical protein Q7K43_05755, partial [Candidatus Woesearchaeota archaeon]|nr:hypothetical protein [Candidatus Woesearchaeota archaeon]
YLIASNVNAALWDLISKTNPQSAELKKVADDSKEKAIEFYEKAIHCVTKIRPYRDGLRIAASIPHRALAHKLKMVA